METRIRNDEVQISVTFVTFVTHMKCPINYAKQEMHYADWSTANEVKGEGLRVHV